MTFREKFYKDFPEETADPAEIMCPSSYDYEEVWDCESTQMDCDTCWDREIPEKKVLFLCDGKIEGCRDSNRCYMNCKEGENICRHTKDINHAKNFKKKNESSKSYYEIES